MQKRSSRSLPIAALLVASAHAQTVTSTIPICSTALSTTITLPTTVTFCPGPLCNGGGPMAQVTPPPNGIGQAAVRLGEYTSVGADGKTTVLGIWETVYNSMCETGLVPATWTITQPCPGHCNDAPAPTVMPAGFETKVVPCTVCGPHMSTVTLTQPCPTGPYASQTPSVGQTPVGPAPAAGVPGAPAAMASAGAGAGASAHAGPNGASAGAGSGAGAGAQSGPGGATANAGAGSGASAQAGPGMASANVGAGASAQAGNVASQAPAAMMPGNKVAPMNGTAPASNMTKPAAAPGISSYMSSATQTTYAGLTVLAGIFTVLLL